MRHLLTPITIAVLLSVAFAVAEEDTAMRKSDMPQAVLKAFEASYPQTVATEYSKEVVNGQTRYEIETRVGKLEKDFVYLQDGTLLQIEEDMSVKSLPTAIVESVKAAYPDGEIDEADKITRGSTIEFEITIEFGEMEYELLVSSDGEVLSSEEIDDDDEEEEDDGEDEDDEEDDD